MSDTPPCAECGSTEAEREAWLGPEIKWLCKDEAECLRRQTDWAIEAEQQIFRITPL